MIVNNIRNIGTIPSIGESPFETLMRVVFGNGEDGCVLDPLVSPMWQDAAGTIAVTAGGDKVRRIDDISGNGNNATATSDSERPTYRVNGGKPYLEFNGAQSMVFNGTDLNFAQVSAHVGFRASANVQTIIGWPHAATHISPYYRMLIHTSSSERLLSHWNGGSQLFSNATTGWLTHCTGGSSPANGTFWANGLAWGTATAQDPITYPNNQPAIIGRGASNVDRFTGRLYGVAVFNRATVSADAVAIHNWLKNRYT